jgi:predicted Zn finger-like uncharacterized protein
MSLATRCPACGTIFRVVQDQLKVSEGWVRCGQCHEVFHGIEALFDLDSEPGLAARRAARNAPPPPPVTPSARGISAAVANAPTEPMPLTPRAAPAAPTPPAPAPSPPVATPSSAIASGSSARAANAVAPSPPPAAPVPTPAVPTPAASSKPAWGSMPAPAPSTPASPRGMAPRFAARLAEASRGQAPSVPMPAASARAPSTSAPVPFSTSSPVPFSDSAHSPFSPSGRTPFGNSAPAPFSTSGPAPFRPSVRAPFGNRAPAPFNPSARAPFTPSAPAPFDNSVPAPFDHSAPAPFGNSAPAPFSTSAPVPYSSAHMPFSATTGAMPLEARSVEPKVAPEPARSAEAAPVPEIEHVDITFDADLPEPPETLAPFGEAPAAKAPAPAEAPAPAPVARRSPPSARSGASNGGAGLPSRLAEDADAAADEEARAGPPTLASMLPETAGEWPPRRKAKPKKAPATEKAATSETIESTVPSKKDPRFLREARRGERWNRPWVRASLGVALVVLVVAAASQVAYPLRDTIASRWPSTLPAWTMLCEQLDCTIEAPRSLGSLALDGSSLTRTDTEHVLLFSADLHNRSDHAVRTPSFDLSFMDLNGQIVARKVLDPAQIGIQQGSIGPEAELHVHARLQMSGLDATGFQADMFYP